MMSQITRRCRAFTLLELMATSAIAALVMSAALVVLGLLSRDRLRAAAAQRLEPDRALPAILVWDIINARQVFAAPEGGELRLIGYGSLNSTRLVPSGRPCSVTYRIVVDQNKSSLLLRRQSLLDDSPQIQPWAEAVAFNIRSISAESMGTDQNAETAAMSAQNTSPARLGRSVHVAVVWQDGKNSQRVVCRY